VGKALVEAEQSSDLDAAPHANVLVNAVWCIFFELLDTHDHAGSESNHMTNTNKINKKNTDT
jgi:hypothetical protein